MCRSAVVDRCPEAQALRCALQCPPCLPHTPAGRARPLPSTAVRLRRSNFATAVGVNRAYLHRLDADRFLHNFQKYARLGPKAPIYKGWESDTIASHTLGNYLTALALTYQQTGDPETVIGQPETVVMQRGYAVVTRRWRAGDTVAMTLPLDLRLKATPGNERVVALVRGPMVLTADLSDREKKWQQVDPALVGADLLAGFTAVDAGAARYATRGILRPANLSFVLFYRQYHRRSAIYFGRFSKDMWNLDEAAYSAKRARLRDIAARSVDVMFLGEMQPKRDHHLTSEISFPATYRGRKGRDVCSDRFMEFVMKVAPGPLIPQTTYWGGQRRRDFDVLIDDTKLASQHLEHDRQSRFFNVDYPVPLTLTRGKQSVHVRFVPRERSSAGPVFGVRLYTARSDVTT